MAILVLPHNNVESHARPYFALVSPAICAHSMEITDFSIAYLPYVPVHGVFMTCVFWNSNFTGSIYYIIVREFLLECTAFWYIKHISHMSLFFREAHQTLTLSNIISFILISPDQNKNIKKMTLRIFLLKKNIWKLKIRKDLLIKEKPISSKLTKPPARYSVAFESRITIANTW